jgi:AcrR family transcriptional regulator
MKEKAMPGRPNRKAQILAATEVLLRERGVGGVTTRAIAEAVACSEGAIYVHFKDRLELLLAVLQGSLPEMLVPLRQLEIKAGLATPQQNLETAMRGLIRFHERVAPMLFSLVADPELLGRFQRSLQDAGKGPNRGIAALGNYIKQEQKMGRIAMGVDAMTAARMMMAGSFFHVFTMRLLGGEDKLDVKRLVGTAIGRALTARRPRFALS